MPLLEKSSLLLQNYFIKENKNITTVQKNTLRKVCKNTGQCTVLIRRNFPYLKKKKFFNRNFSRVLNNALHCVLGLKETSVNFTEKVLEILCQSIIQFFRFIFLPVQ